MSAARLIRLAVAVALSPALVASQTTDDINSSLQFNFSNPGARSLALGGAFTARADDATAAYANPAGLVQLSKPEVSVDGRGWSFSDRFLDGGEQLSDGGFEGLDFRDTDSSARGLSFLSAFYPSRRGRWVLGAFRHESARYDTAVRSGGALVGEPGSLALARPLDGRYSLWIESLGLAGAWSFGDRLSLGITLTGSRLELDSRTERLNKLRSEVEPADPSPLEEGSAPCCEFGNDPGDVITFQTQSEQGDGWEPSWSLGWLWRSGRTVEGVPVLAVGGVYRKGPRLDFRGDSFFRRRPPPPFLYRSQVGGDEGPIACRGASGSGCPGVFKVPDVAGIGVSLRPALAWVVALDVNRVEYSDLLDETLEIVRADDPERGLAQGERGRPVDFRLDDGYEVRVGVELALFRERRLPDLFFRVGGWLDPDHEMRYVGPDVERRAIWAPGDDEIHLAAGCGVRYRSFQLDVAADWSDRVRTVSVSSVFYLGRR